MSTYIAILRKDEGSDYGVSFPDFPGCVTAGSTLQEAMTMAQEAIELHIEGLVEDEEDIPAPSVLDEIVQDPENTDGVTFLVQVRNTKARAVRVNITIPSDLLEEIDKEVERKKTNRSAFLAEAARLLLED